MYQIQQLVCLINAIIVLKGNWTLIQHHNSYKQMLWTIQQIVGILHFVVVTSAQILCVILTNINLLQVVNTIV